jgi:hypothetical protein
MTFLSHKSFFAGEFELEDEVESVLMFVVVVNDFRGDSFVNVFRGESFAGEEKFVLGIVPVFRGEAVGWTFLIVWCE